MKKYLIINHNSPLTAGFCPEEALELVLTISALEDQVSMLLLQHASLMLLSNYNYDLLARKTLQQTLAAFNLFEIETIFIEKFFFDQLISWNININQLQNLQPFVWKDFTKLCYSHDIILSL